MNKGEQAANLFHDGYNCAQAVIGVFCDELGLDKETAFKLSSSFGGGMGRLREVCGAVSGMFMVAGLKAGYSGPTDIEAKLFHYKLIRSMAERFAQEHGSIICRDLLRLEERCNAQPTTENYPTHSSCDRFVACAARIAEEVLFEK